MILEPPVAAGQEKDKARPCRKKRATVLTQQNSWSITFPPSYCLSLLLSHFVYAAHLSEWFVLSNLPPSCPTLSLFLPCRLISGSFSVKWLIWVSCLSEKAEKQGLSCHICYKASVKWGKLCSLLFSQVAIMNWSQCWIPFMPSRCRLLTPSDHRLVI